MANTTKTESENRRSGEGSITVDQLCFQYPGSSQQQLENVTFRIPEGSFCLICGPSGSGKTTLLKLLKPELSPHGKRSGTIHIGLHQLDSKGLSSQGSAADIGMVQQDPDAQIILDTVAQELAFGLENLGVDQQTMRRRVAEMAGCFDLEELLETETDTLSGGQKQLLNLASVLALKPRILLLDEPTAQLDPVAAKGFLQTIDRLREELGLTVVMTEHRMDDLIAIADQMIFMDQGRLKFAGTPQQVIKSLYQSEQAVYVPDVPSLVLRMEEEQLSVTWEATLDDLPLGVKDGRRVWKQRWSKLVQSSKSEQSANVSQYMLRKSVEKSERAGDTIMICRDLSFQYRVNQRWVLNRCQLQVHRGECLTILGANGSGKTTLLQMMAGLLKPQRGDVRHVLLGKLQHIKPRERYQEIGYLAQNPLWHFAEDAVRAELIEAANRYGKSEEIFENLIIQFELAHLLDRHPYDLSGGERQRLALAAVMIRQPNVLLLDEPTKGMDPASKQKWKGWLETIRSQGVTVVMVTHDISFAAAVATRCMLLFAGEITAEDKPNEFFSENYFYTPVISRVVRDELPNALGVDEVLASCRDKRL